MGTDKLLAHRNNFKTQPSLTTADVDAAWNIFQYQYAGATFVR